MDHQEAKNTDRELYCEPDTTGNGSYYSNKVFVTQGGAIGMSVGGHVLVMSIDDWFNKAKSYQGPPITEARRQALASIRTPLLTFAVLMEEKLRKNDHKTGWRQLPVEALIRLMKLELEEFAVADEFFPVVEARRELVDVANFCMMLHDRLGMLDQNRTRESQPIITDCDTGVKS